MFYFMICDDNNSSHNNLKYDKRNVCPRNQLLKAYDIIRLH